MLSKLYQDDSPFTQPVGCESGRQEYKRVLKKDGQLYTVTVRDKIVPEDPYLVLVKAYIWQLREGKVYPGQRPDRRFRDFLVKTNIII